MQRQQGPSGPRLIRKMLFPCLKKGKSQLLRGGTKPGSTVADARVGLLSLLAVPHSGEWPCVDGGFSGIWEWL